MNVIGEQQFMQVLYDNDKHLITSIWQGDNDMANEHIIREHIDFLANIILRSPAKYCLADDRQRKFTYSIDIQQWVAHTLVSACIHAGIRRFAVILPQDLIAAISTEQVGDETGDAATRIRFFQDETTALAWLLGQ